MAVLWDMDGTIVDTEPYWIEAEYALVEGHGGVWSESHAEQLVGQSLAFTAGALQAAGVGLEVREIVDSLSSHVEQRVRDRLPWRPGARELLEDLHAAHVRCALVTMSHGPLVRAVVDQLPKPYFDAIVTGDTVEFGKPHPEAYSTAITLLRHRDPALTIDECIAIEDSGPGVAAAMAAGLTTVAVPHMAPIPDESGRTLWESLAGKTIADLERLVGTHAGR